MASNWSVYVPSEPSLQFPLDSLSWNYAILYASKQTEKKKFNDFVIVYVLSEKRWKSMNWSIYTFISGFPFYCFPILLYYSLFHQKNFVPYYSNICICELTFILNWMSIAVLFWVISSIEFIIFNNNKPQTTNNNITLLH